MTAPRSRWLVLAAVTSAVAVGLAVQALRSGDEDEQWRTINDDASGITLAHPREWKVQTLGRYCRRIGPGVLVSNVSGHTFRNVPILDGCTNQWDLNDLPPRYVVIDVSLFSGPSPHRPETPLPLLLARFDRNPNGYAFTRVRRDGNDYTVRIWFGRMASDADQEAAARLIQSLAFRPPAST